MSPSKLNSLLTGFFFAIVVAVGGSVMAQDGLRLFKPYSPESFGGGRRGNDGVYSSVSGIYWSISTPKDGYIGATTVKGNDEIRWVYDGAANVTRQNNSARIDLMGPTTTLGTRFDVGNRRGHHGWLITGYNLPEQRHRLNFQHATIVIRDEGNKAIDGSVGYVLSPQSNYPNAMWEPAGPQTTVGFLWGIFDDTTGGVTGTADARFAAPLPIRFESLDVNVRSSHLSAELMYTYRLHPFVWGGMELLAGVRYWDFEDTFGLYGNNLGVPDEEGVYPDVDLGYLALSNMSVNARGENRIFGPQFGVKLSRHNARWTFGAEGRLTAGINAQSVKTQGYIIPNSTMIPLGLQGGSNTNFGYKKSKTYFSPIGELRLTADWQWTSAISFFGALDGMFAGNIARGVRITDYVVSDNQIFGIRGNDRNTTVLVYGVELGIKMRR